MTTAAERDILARSLGKAAGARNGHETEAEVVPIDVRKAKLRGRIKSPADIRDMQPPPAIVPGWLSKGDLAVVYGSPKAAKSLTTQDLANSRGTNRSWLGLHTEPGSTLYMAAEGTGGLGKRIRAWEDYNGTPGDNVHYLPGSVNLLDELMVCDVADLAVELAVDMVVVDTIARTMVGGDENGPKDMNRLVAGLDHIREKSGALALGVHHAGKDETKGMRGHSSLLGAVDGVLYAQMANKVLTITAECLRDFEPGPPIQARLVPHLDSVVLEPIASAAHGSIPHPVLVTLQEIDDSNGVPTSVWLTASEVSNRTFYRTRTQLIGAGLVVNVGTESKPRYRAVNP
jgi:hypothetical protein